MPEKVWFSEARERSWVESKIYRAKDLFYEAGLDECVDKGDYSAIKIHLGEWGRTHVLRPECVAAMSDVIKREGGRPFVTDTTTQPYSHCCSRINAIVELITAAYHGFTPGSMGCPIIIADGFAGEDDVVIQVPNGNILKESYTARGIAEADNMIVTTHGKGHPMTAYGGAIKNLGIGAQSKRGKYNSHLAMWGEPEDHMGWPVVVKENCPGLKGCPVADMCMRVCPVDAITVKEDTVDIDWDKCYMCQTCQWHCIIMATSALKWRDDYWPMNQIAMSDAAMGTLNNWQEPGKEFTKYRDKVGQLCYLIDNDQMCDCVPWADLPVAPDIGTLATKDIVAMDASCVDLVDQSPIGPWSVADEKGIEVGQDRYELIQDYSPRIHIKAMEMLKAGDMEYELVEYEPVLTNENVFKWAIDPARTSGDMMRPYFARQDMIKEVIERFGGFKRVPFDEDWPKRAWKEDYWKPGMEKAKKMVDEVKKVFPLAEVPEK